MRRFTSVEDMESEVGKEVAVSDWLVLTQDRVNQFAEATDDPQWIHVDVERAEASEKHGILMIRLPKINKKRETKLRARTISHSDNKTSNHKVQAQE
jgi:acyl dehydratase